MHFHLPRRHRRPLLLPPGLLALAGLLWLGCIQVGVWHEQLKQWHVLDLTMPIYTTHHEKHSIRFELPNPDSVCISCSWKDIYLTDKNNYADRNEQIGAEKAVHAMMANMNDSSGVRIRFARTARFKQLIFAFNTLERENVRKYWLDIYHAPITLYAFHEPHTLAPQPFELDCLLCNDIMLYKPSVLQLPFWVRFDNQVAEFWQFGWLRPLTQSEWRASVWLLAIIAALSSWRIIRNWRAA
jgi:hypothetical protein